MLNQLVVVGRIVNDPTKENIEGKEIFNLTLAVPRSYKNEEGIYETDFIDIVLNNMLAGNVITYCHKGDLVGIKGRLQSKDITNEDGSIVKRIIEVIAEKVTFLSSNTKDIKQDDNIVVNID